MEKDKPTAEHLIMAWVNMFAPYRDQWQDLEPVYSGIEKWLRAMYASRVLSAPVLRFEHKTGAAICCPACAAPLARAGMMGGAVAHRGYMLVKCTACQADYWIPERKAIHLPAIGMQ